MNNAADAESALPAEFTSDSPTQQMVAFTGSELTNPALSQDWFAINARNRENQQHLPTVTLDEFLNESERVLHKIDLDKDGYVGAPEMAQAVDNPFIIGKDAQILSGLYSLSNASREKHPFGGYRNPLQFIKVENAQEHLETLFSAGDRRNRARHSGELNFDQLNGNTDNVIDRAELSESMKNPLLAGGQLAVAMKFFYKEELKAIEQGKTYAGLTADNIETLNQVMGDTDVSAFGIVKGAIERTAEAQRSVRSTDAFADRENPINSIKPEAINQGFIGNCYFESVLISIAQKRPELIHDMIEDQGYGVYKVTFLGDKEHPVTVSAPSDVNLGQFNKGGKDGAWPNILEKAFGRYKILKNNQVELNFPDAKGGDWGGDPADVMALLTGNDTHSGSIGRKIFEINSNNPEYVRHQAQSFIDWLDEGRLITVETDESNPKNRFNLQATHALTLMSHYEQDGKTYFVVRDPWNRHSTVKGNKDGVFALEAKDFLEAFPNFTVEVPKKPES